ncbi:MAG: WcaF family extracellular polysaccharide biosynthesis acetyltransferase [Methylacidiphilales bacterium]|nr:WcaF family extracellular polysaccharide biosynthesis acetyltransferase [Candidatus Methylacidiphilales bacterium]
MQLNRYDNSAFDRGAGRLKEAFWILCKCLFFQNPFPWPSFLRVFFLRLFGAKIGKGMVIRSGANITFPWRFKAGDHVWIGEDACILSLAEVVLGSNVCVSQRAYLCTGSHNFRKGTFDLITRPIRIEDSVWIAAQAFVGPGVTIGHDSLVSVGSVLLRSAAPGTMSRGNPCRTVSIHASA